MKADTAARPPPARTTGPVFTESPHHRLRWAMHGSLAVIALLMAVACWSAWNDEQRRSTDGELINLAGAQRMLSQRTALLANAGTPDSLFALDTALARAQSDSLRIEKLLDAYDETRLAQLPPELTAAVRLWQDSRERLWYRAQNMARSSVDHPGKPDGDSARAIQADAETALAAAERWFTRYRCTPTTSHKGRCSAWLPWPCSVRCCWAYLR